jgi:iron complex outermembrane receptor protein
VLATNASNSYQMNVNPYRDLVTTVPLHVQINDNMRWETNAYLWWGEGGATFGSTSLTEGSYTNGYLVAPTYGDPAGSTNALLSTESTVNQTFRPGVTTKFVYDADNITYMAGAWYEQSHQHYDQAFGLVNSNLKVCDTWLTGATNNACAIQGTSINGAGPVYAQNYMADSVGKSVFGEVQGRFLNDSLKITAGLAERAIVRDVHNYNPICADNPTLAFAPGSTIACASYATSTPFLESSAFTYFNGAGVGAAAAYAAMRQYAANPKQTYQAMLPELAGSYDIDDNQQLFASVSTGFRSPSVSNFGQFTSGNTATASNIMKLAAVKSEYNTSWEAGYRWHDSFVQASATAYLQDLKNYQASVQIDPADYITSNIGGVKIYGIDVEAGTQPWHNFTFYVSGELQNSHLNNNLSADYSGTYPNDIIQYVNTKGKQLVDTPNWIVSASVGYAEDGFFGEAVPQCKGQRATSLLNDEFVPGYCTVNLSAGYHFGNIMGGMFKNATFQVYADNATDTK